MKYIVLMNGTPSEDDIGMCNGIQIFTMDDIEGLVTLHWKCSLMQPKNVPKKKLVVCKPTDLLSLMYTSGSTGIPKVRP